MVNPVELASAAASRRRLADGSSEFSTEWLAAENARVIAQESGRHLELEEAQSMTTTLGAYGIQSLLAIANDPLVPDEMVYALDATPEDLYEMSREFGGISVLLLPLDRDDVCVLFTADDFKLIAGPEAFLVDYAGDLLAARADFLAFASDHLDEIRPVLDRAAAYMDWIGV